MAIESSRIRIFVIAMVLTIAISFDRVIPIIIAIDFDRVFMEDIPVGNRVPLSAYGLKDGDRVGHRLEFDLIGEVINGTMDVRLDPHPATDNEYREVTPNKMVSIGREYHFIHRKNLPGDPAPNRFAYGVALYAVHDPQRRTLKAFAAEKAFEDSPEGQARIERDREKIRAQFIHSMDKVIDKFTDINSKYQVLKTNFKTITGHDFSDETFAKYREGTLEKPSIEESTEDSTDSIEDSTESPKVEKPSKTRNRRTRSKT